MSEAPHIELAVRDKAALYAIYMPFVQGGGLFIPNHTEFKMGDEVQLTLDIMQGTERLTVHGKIVWITPAGASGQRARGSGMQFVKDEGGAVQKKIETYLAGILESDKRTHTL